jgi:uncharacterized protein YegL
MDIVCVLDRSGSMSDIIAEATSGFNAFIKDQKNLNPTARVTVVIFDNEYDVLYNKVPIREVKELSMDVYYPRGMTALNDAVGRAITSATQGTCSNCSCQKDSNKKILWIVTDGQENCSKEFTSTSVKELITEWRDTGGETVFLASDDFNSSRTVMDFNLNVNNHIKFTKGASGSKGLSGAFGVLHATTSAYSKS